MQIRLSGNKNRVGVNYTTTTQNKFSLVLDNRKDFGSGSSLDSLLTVYLCSPKILKQIKQINAKYIHICLQTPFLIIASSCVFFSLYLTCGGNICLNL